VEGGVEAEVEVEVARRVAWVEAAVVEESALRASDLGMAACTGDGPSLLLVCKTNYRPLRLT
jgi:hypothetical protein